MQDCSLEPAAGSETGKTRPCIVITNDVQNSILPVIRVVPITGWTEKKSQILTNVEIHPDEKNGLSKLLLADCLQTRPIDYTKRMVRIRGNLGKETHKKINCHVLLPDKKILKLSRCKPKIN